MIRFILQRRHVDHNMRIDDTDHYTMDVDAPELEAALRRGGFGEQGYERHTLTGIELRDDDALETFDEQEAVQASVTDPPSILVWNIDGDIRYALHVLYTADDPLHWTVKPLENSPAQTGPRSFPDIASVRREYNVPPKAYRQMLVLQTKTSARSDSVTFPAVAFKNAGMPFIATLDYQGWLVTAADVDDANESRYENANFMRMLGIIDDATFQRMQEIEVLRGGTS